jgi:phage shock protein C
MRRLYLSKTDKKIAGICGGIGETYDIDPTLIRLGLVFLCLVTAIIPVGLTYLIGWLVIPDKPAEQAYETSAGTDK